MCVRNYSFLQKFIFLSVKVGMKIFFVNCARSQVPLIYSLKFKVSTPIRFGIGLSQKIDCFFVRKRGLIAMTKKNWIPSAFAGLRAVYSGVCRMRGNDRLGLDSPVELGNDKVKVSPAFSDLK